jgi:major vault protein
MRRCVFVVFTIVAIGKNKARKAGENWLIRDVGAYMLQVPEEEVALCQAYVLTSNDALIVRANVSFTTADGKVRAAGEEYLVTSADTATFIPDVHETVVAQQPIVSLSRRQYCIVQQSGRFRDGTAAPRHDRGSPRRAELLSQAGRVAHQRRCVQRHCARRARGLAVRCLLPFDDNGVARKPGELIEVRGPGEYVPRVEVRVEWFRRAKLSFQAFDLHFFFQSFFPSSILQATPINVEPRNAAGECSLACTRSAQSQIVA